MVTAPSLTRIAALAVALTACNHSDPFTSGAPQAPRGPFKDSRPLQLTYNLGLDGWPSWSPDGAQVFYSAQQSGPDFDRCIVVLPAGGGSGNELRCPPRTADGLTEEFDQPVSDGSRVVWLRAAVPAGQERQYQWSLWSARINPPTAPVKILDFPYTAPSGHPHDLPRFLQWLKPGVLLYLGSEAGGTGQTDTLQFGEQVVLLDVSGPTPVKTFVPGTERASAVSGSEDGSTIYYTLYGDSVVYARTLAGGAVSVLHDFGFGRVVRDPAVSGNRLAVVLDGMPQVRDIIPFGLSQVDFGGDIFVVDLTTGDQTQLLDLEHWYKHPRFAPGGGRLVAEAYPYQIFTIIISPNNYLTDTTVTLINDVWVWEE
jgi:hypothetical protein